MNIYIDVPNSLMDRNERVGAIITAAAGARAVVRISPAAAAEPDQADPMWKARYVELCTFLQEIITQADEVAVDVYLGRDHLARLRPFLQWAVEP